MQISFKATKNTPVGMYPLYDDYIFPLCQQGLSYIYIKKKIKQLLNKQKTLTVHVACCVK